VIALVVINCVCKPVCKSNTTHLARFDTHARSSNKTSNTSASVIDPWSWFHEYQAMRVMESTKLQISYSNCWDKVLSKLIWKSYAWIRCRAACAHHRISESRLSAERELSSVGAHTTVFATTTVHPVLDKSALRNVYAPTINRFLFEVLTNQLFTKFV
jgi:hypothetical protein